MSSGGQMVAHRYVQTRDLTRDTERVRLRALVPTHTSGSRSASGA